MTDAAIDQAKVALRRDAHAARAALSAAYRAEAAERLAEIALAGLALSSHRTVAGYWPIRDELDCRPLLRKLRASGLGVALPVVRGREEPLDFRLWTAEVALVPAGFGTLAPPLDAPAAVPDLVLLPLLGFDDSGTRLGYGGGFYDRTLAALPVRPRLVGLAFAAQHLAAIPRDQHDIPLDAVVTEDGVRMFGEAR